MRYTDMKAVREANRKIGHFFFSAGATSFFNLRFETGLIEGRYFVTSESPANENDPEYTTETDRKYTVRVARDNGNISTLGEFREHETLSSAWDAAMDHYHSQNVNGDVPGRLFE